MISIVSQNDNIYLLNISMNTSLKNLFQAIPEQIPEELFQTLFSNQLIKIERIISKGQKSMENDWYDQEQDEWILLVQGIAELEYLDPADRINLNPGDYLLIPAHQKHRVNWTNPKNVTIWLAIHLMPDLSRL